MLPRIYRLRLDKNFKNVFKYGQILENQFFRVKFIANQKKINRFGFVVNVKLLKKAASRNVIKRRLRSIIRLLIKDLKTGFDVVIWPKPASLSIDYKNLTRNLMDLLGKL